MHMLQKKYLIIIQIYNMTKKKSKKLNLLVLEFLNLTPKRVHGLHKDHPKNKIKAKKHKKYGVHGCGL